ncbi:hypothetical protein LCGC14_1961590 [marine sediment metagenome]|uniref:Uncharacterized protein n=1 Tax=marine sediment metagenome TaxID=412755 RepID=A0A0F9FEG0_9ZZZZ
MKEVWATSSECLAFHDLARKEIDELVDGALDDKNPKAKSGKLVEGCITCGKEKDIGIECWWCGCK